jgi:cysteinyl-tRNA synthetase
LKQAERNLERLTNAIEYFSSLKEGEQKGLDDEALLQKTKEVEQKFEKAMDDDFNTPLALASIFEFVNEVNKAIDEKKVSKENLNEVYDLMMDFDKVLGVLEHEKGEIPKEIMNLIIKREGYRKRGDFAEADKIRRELAEKGILVEDSPEGPRWKKIR